MASVTIVSGCPGAGKTTLARALATSTPVGLHLDSDVFYSFPALRLDPTTPESRQQNTVILAAVGSAAAAFFDGGYDVIIDGVVGPWLLPTVREAVGLRTPLPYVLLRVDMDVALARVRDRDGRGASARVAHMHLAFSELRAHESHVVDTTCVEATELFRRITSGLERGDFAV